MKFLVNDSVHYYIFVTKAYKNICKKTSTELDIDSVQYSIDGGIHPA